MGHVELCVRSGLWALGLLELYCITGSQKSATNFRSVGESGIFWCVVCERASESSLRRCEIRNYHVPTFPIWRQIRTAAAGRKGTGSDADVREATAEVLLECH